MGTVPGALPPGRVGSSNKLRRPPPGPKAASSRVRLSGSGEARRNRRLIRLQFWSVCLAKLAPPTIITDPTILLANVLLNLILNLIERGSDAIQTSSHGGAFIIERRILRSIRA